MDKRLNQILTALAALAPTDDVRYFMNGVYVNGRRLAVTNGHYLITVDMTDEIEATDVILPTRALRSAMKAAGTAPVSLRGSTLDTEAVGSIEVGVVEGRFPDVDRIARKRDDAEPAACTLDIGYLAKLSQAIKKLAKRTVRVETAGPNDPVTLKAEGDGCTVTAYLQPIGE